MASYSPAWAPVQSIPPQRSAEPAGRPAPQSSLPRPTAVLGFAAMAAVGATGAIGLATPASAAVNDSARGAAVAQESYGQTATLTRPEVDPGTALADRIMSQAVQQRSSTDDTARRQAAAAARSRQQQAAAEATARQAADEAIARVQAAHAQAVQEAQAAAQAEAQAKAEAGVQDQARTAAEVRPRTEAAASPSVEAGPSAGPGGLVAPLSVPMAGPGFGQSGSDSLWSQLHTGQDFTAPTGTPVVAIGDGSITSAGWAGAYGYRVVETLSDGTEVWYCHLSVVGPCSGEVVAGQPVGRVGATGNVNAPHLHLEVRPDGGEPVDPAAWLAQHGLTL